MFSWTDHIETVVYL